MRTESESDDTLIQYLRGELAEEERNRVEEAYFGDDRLHERLLMLEDQWIDSYVSGQLPPDERERFERWLRISPERQRRVDFAEALRRAAAQAPVPLRRSSWQSVLDFHPLRPPAVWLAVAAAAAVVLVVPLVYFQRSRPGGAPPQQQEIAHQAPAPRAVPVLAFALSPLARSADEGNRVVIPSGEYTIRLLLDVEDGNSSGLSASVRTAEGAPVADAHGLAPRTASPGQSVVTLELPASQLRAGDYVVRLSRTATDGTAEPVAGYTFRVERPARPLP